MESSTTITTLIHWYHFAQQNWLVLLAMYTGVVCILVLVDAICNRMVKR